MKLFRETIIDKIIEFYNDRINTINKNILKQYLYKI